MVTCRLGVGLPSFPCHPGSSPGLVEHHTTGPGRCTACAERGRVGEPGWLAGTPSLLHLGTAALPPDNGSNCTVSTGKRDEQIPVLVTQMANYCGSVRSNTEAEGSEERQQDSPGRRRRGRAGNQTSIPQSHRERSNWSQSPCRPGQHGLQSCPRAQSTPLPSLQQLCVYLAALRHARRSCQHFPLSFILSRLNNPG